MIRLPWCGCCPEAITRVLLFSHLGHHIHAHRSHQRGCSPGPARISLFLSFANGYKAATLLRDCDKCDVLSCCDWLWNQCVSLGNVCTPCSYCCFLITAVCSCCCGVVGAGVGVVFVRVNNCCKVSPPRVSRVMGTFIAAFINLHITITTQGRPMCHVISAEKEEIIGLPKTQGCWCKTNLVLIPLNLNHSKLMTSNIEFVHYGQPRSPAP